MVGGNYVNRFNLNGRSYEVIPQVPRAERLTPASLGQYYVKTGTGERAAVDRGVDRPATATLLTQYNQLNSATFSAVPMPGVTMGDAVAFLERQADELLPPTSSTLTSGIAPVRHRGQPAGDHLCLRAGGDLPGAGGPIRVAARSLW